MVNVWKIGSRWSEDGNRNSSILSVFRRNNIVFTGRNDEFDFEGKVKHGDYFAIADGTTVVAVAKVISDKPFQINKSKLRFRSTDFSGIQEEKDLSFAYGVHVKIIDLDMSQWFYQKQGSFFHTNEETSEKVINLFENDLSTKFDIISKTYRIFSEPNKNDGKESIISRDHYSYYTIPVYQREYSWQQEQIHQFVNDIFTGFWGTNEREIVREPLFIGTMQLSYRKYIKEGEYEQDVIDGQQRLSTILCLIKYLQLKFPDNDFIKVIQTNWLETRVNSGKEEEYLEEMLGLFSLDQLSEVQLATPNAYLRNLSLINNSIDEILTRDDTAKDFFNDNLGEFISYLLNDVYIVVVETIAGLSKTIKIFNTINTSGLDLNGDDLFKVRFYEYLRDTNKYGEDAFDRISNIYKKVKDINADWRVNHGDDMITMEKVRSVYKLYLISKYDLPTVLYSKSTDTFFSELFDVLLKVQKHEDVNNIGKLEMDLNDIHHIIDTILLWNKSTFLTSDQLITQYLIDYSRYERYGNIAFLLLLNNEHISSAEERINRVYKVLRVIARYFFIKSIEFTKVVYEVHSFMYRLYRATFHNTEEEILSILYSELDNYDFEYFSSEHLKKDIVERTPWKNIICLLSAFLDEIESNRSIVEMNNLFTWGYFDIEHIHATANSEENDGITLEEQNSIGNLMLLEQGINRSIGDLSFNEKKSRSDGNVCYKDSKYATVRKISQYQTWGRNEIIQRREEVSKRIIIFLKDYKNK